MSARRPLFNCIVAPLAAGPVGTADAKEMLDNYRAEVLTEAAAMLGRLADTVEARVTEDFGPASGIGPGSADMLREAGRAVLDMAGKDTSDVAQAAAGESTRPVDAAALLALATVLEIPRPNTAIPLQLRRSHGYADRWAICDRTGRRWYRGLGWMFEPADDRLCDDGRFPLAEAVPLAREIAATEFPTTLGEAP